MQKEMDKKLSKMLKIGKFREEYTESLTLIFPLFCRFENFQNKT